MFGKTSITAAFTSLSHFPSEFLLEPKYLPFLKNVQVHVLKKSSSIVHKIYTYGKPANFILFFFFTSTN